MSIAEAGRLGNAWHLLGTLTKKEARHHRVPALPGGKRPAQLPGTAGLAFSLPARSWPRSRNVRDSLLGSYAGLCWFFICLQFFNLCNSFKNLSVMNIKLTDWEINRFNLVKLLFDPQQGETSQSIVSFSIVRLMPYYDSNSILYRLKNKSL